MDFRVWSAYSGLRRFEHLFQPGLGFESFQILFQHLRD